MNEFEGFTDVIKLAVFVLLILGALVYGIADFLKRTNTIPESFLGVLVGIIFVSTIMIVGYMLGRAKK